MKLSEERGGRRYPAAGHHDRIESVATPYRVVHPLVRVPVLPVVVAVVMVVAVVCAVMYATIDEKTCPIDCQTQGVWPTLVHGSRLFTVVVAVAVVGVPVLVRGAVAAAWLAIV